jgi:pimeloyl-ACP methyl ester carboxylesterase
MGGMIAQELAINHPERVQKLVLASTVSSASQIAPELLGLFGLHEDFSEGDWASVDVRQGFGSATALAFNSRLYRMLVGLLFPICDRLGWFERLKGQRGAVAGCDTLDRLHTIRAPTLVIVGTEEKCVQLHASEVMASRIPNAKLVKVDGATHAQIFEMRSRFNKEVLNFLRA